MIITNVRSKLQYADSSFGRGLSASRVKPSVVSKVLAPSQRLASQEWTTSKAPRFSCPFTLLRGSCYKMSTTFGDSLTGHPRGCKIEGYLRQSSLLTPLMEAFLMMWRCCAINWGFGSWSSLFGDYAPNLRPRAKNHLQHLVTNFISLVINF